MYISIYTDKSHLYYLYIQLDNFNLNYLYFTGKIFFCLLYFQNILQIFPKKKLSVFCVFFYLVYSK